MTMSVKPEAFEIKQPSMNVPDVNAWLGDVFSSQDTDKTITCGFFRLEASEAPLDYEYTYEEMKYIVDGEFVITDEEGTRHHAKRGDVFYFRKGSKIRFETPSFGVGFFCGQRREGEG